MVPDEPGEALAVLFTPAAAAWSPVELYRLRRQLIDELADMGVLERAVERIDELRGLHA